jgi:hypothetical protein
LDPTSSEDLPHLLALLFLILLDDIFNPNVFQGQRTPDQVLYTTHLKGIAWEVVAYLDKAYTWEALDNPSLEHPITTALSFQPAFYRLFGKQLGYIKRLRQPFLGKNLTRPDDYDRRSTIKNTATLEKELEMASLQDREVEEAYKAVVVGVPESLTPILDDLESIQSWNATEDEHYLHRILSTRERVVLGACQRDREELARSEEQPRPRILSLY